MTVWYSCLPPCPPIAVESQIEVPRFLFALVPRPILFDARLDIGPSCSRLRCRQFNAGADSVTNLEGHWLAPAGDSGLIPVNDEYQS